MQTDISKNWLRLLKIVARNEDAIFKNYLLIPIIHSKLVINYGQDLCLRVVTSTNMVKGLQKSDLFSKKNNIIGTVGLMCSFLHDYGNSLHISFLYSYNEFTFFTFFLKEMRKKCIECSSQIMKKEKRYIFT